MSPALAGGFFTTQPPEKPWSLAFVKSLLFDLGENLMKYGERVSSYPLGMGDLPHLGDLPRLFIGSRLSEPKEEVHKFSSLGREAWIGQSL